MTFVPRNHRVRAPCSPAAQSCSPTPELLPALPVPCAAPAQQCCPRAGLCWAEPAQGPGSSCRTDGHRWDPQGSPSRAAPTQPLLTAAMLRALHLNVPLLGSPQSAHIPCILGAQHLTQHPRCGLTTALSRGITAFKLLAILLMLPRVCVMVWKQKWSSWAFFSFQVSKLEQCSNFLLAPYLLPHDPSAPEGIGVSFITSYRQSEELIRASNAAIAFTTETK